jgi:carboxymethylenebutenolidase
LVFCFGGWIANMMAVKSQPWALQFRIMVANPQQRSRTHKTPILAQYARHRVNDGWPAYETYSRRNKVECRLFFMKEEPWFHNNTTPTMKKAATLSWTRTIDF